MTKNKKQPSPTCTQNVRSYFSQFCDSTSIHGIRYLGERGRFVIEKLIWITIITIVFSLCIYLIYKTYHKWVTQPVIVTFATTEIPIWKIPFPAVTICPEVKCDPEKFNYTDILIKKKELTGEELDLFLSVSLVCSVLSESGAFENITNTRFSNLPFDNLEKVFPDHREDNLSEAKWLGKKLPMDELATTYTKEGICYTFNMLDSVDIVSIDLFGKNLTEEHLVNEWSLIDGYLFEDSEDAYPERSFISGIDGGFEIDLFTKHSHLDYLCGRFLQGFKVILHHPSEFPSMDRHFQLPLDQVMYIGIKPQMITVGEELKTYKPADRNCYFPDEKALAFYKNYTQNNCLSECLSNYTLKHCQCLGFHMVGFFDDTPICGPLSYECMKNSSVKYLLKQDVHFDEDVIDEEDNASDCDCLPSCTSLKYGVETSQSDLDWRPTMKLYNTLAETDIPINLDRDHMSKLVVYYKEMQFLPVERHELYGYVDFFSSTGGLMGLFIGISVTSIIEILYFLTLRLGCNIKKFGPRFWSGDSEFIAAEDVQDVLLNDI